MNDFFGCSELEAEEEDGDAVGCPAAALVKAAGAAGAVAEVVEEGVAAGLVGVDVAEATAPEAAEVVEGVAVFGLDGAADFAWLSLN